MTRLLAGLLVLPLVGLPLLAEASWLTGTIGAAAGVLCVGGIVGWSFRLLRAGAALSLIEYAVALWVSAVPPDILAAVAFGVVLMLLLDVVGFDARFRGAALHPGVLRGQIRYWLGSGATAAGAGFLLALATGRIAVQLPAWAYPAAAALGALGACAGLAGLLKNAVTGERDGE